MICVPFWLVAQQDASSSSEPEHNEEQEQIRIARALLNYRLKEKANYNGPIPFQKKFPNPRPSSPQPPQVTTSKILPLICPKTVPRNRPTTANDGIVSPLQRQVQEGLSMRPQRYPTTGPAPYVPYRHVRAPYQGFAPPVTIRTAVPVFSAPPLPPPSVRSPSLVQPLPVRIAPPVSIRQAVPVFASPPIQKDDLPPFTGPNLPNKSTAEIEVTEKKSENELHESEAVKGLEQLKVWW